MTSTMPDQTGRGPAGESRYPIGRHARQDAAVRLGAVACLGLSVLLVTHWWVVDGGLRGFGGWPSGLISVGRLGGLLASLLLLVQVLLMARVPLLEAAFGQCRLARVHQRVGVLSFSLMLLHIVTTGIGHAAAAAHTRHGGPPVAILLAMAGALCLCMVVLTSIRAALRRTRYESWHLLHLYAYLGVGLALPHQLLIGHDFVASPMKTFFWWTAWASTAAAVLLCRVGLPLWRNARHQLRVESVVPELDNVVSVYVTGRRLDLLRGEPGQFFTWRFLGRPGWTQAHPYSLSAAPNGRSLRITVQVVGEGSASLASLQPGTRVLVGGPYGRLSPRARSRSGVALIGAGVGITPLRALAEGLDISPGEAIVLHRYTTEPLFAAEFAGLERERGLQVVDLPGHRRSQSSWLGDGLDDDLDAAAQVDDLTALHRWIPDVSERDVYVCGPSDWMVLVKRTLVAAGLPAKQLHLETFAW
jgi:predicted ferric reductase